MSAGPYVTGALLFQVCLAGHIPLAPFITAATAVAFGVALSAVRALGRVVWPARACYCLPRHGDPFNSTEAG
jgi:hypothetical protein